MQYPKCVRRVPAIVLLVLFNFALIGPVWIGDADSRANLPACCRRDGKHHCAMSQGAMSEQAMSQAMMPRESGPALSANTKCPLYPAATATTAQDATPLTVSMAQSAISYIVRAAGTTQNEAGYRISFSRARQKRGPPALLS